MMKVLRYSHLDSSKMLVKVVKGGKYGIYNLLDNQVVVKPTFDYLEYWNDNRLVAKKDGYYFEIDNRGNKLNQVAIPEANWMYIDKNDFCSECGGAGCSECCGTGCSQFSSTNFDID